MGIFKDFLSAMLSGSASSNSQIDERPARYTPEEFVILEQEQSGQKWHGVLLSDLSKLARQTFRGKYVKVDEYNFLVFYYSSKSRKHSSLHNVNLTKMVELCGCRTDIIPVNGGIQQMILLNWQISNSRFANTIPA